MGQDAARAIAEAERLIQECGYHRRDDELAELKAIRDGTRSIADLPPRV